MTWTLVTGGTGTVGTALVFRLLRYCNAKVRVMSRDEGKLADLKQALDAAEVPPEAYRMLVGDIRDKDRLARAIEGVEDVFHAAALKHVDSCEYNPTETIKTNILGVQNLVDCAAAAGVKTVVNMSSDKAAAPSNLMGATKLVGERLVAYANAYGRGCRFMSVRFGNILGSRGSVLPLWREQMRQGCIHITDPRMTRYVMSVSDAVDLCLLAHAGRGGETFVLKMPVILLENLARTVVGMWERAHDVPPGSTRREIVGLRPGETQDETIITADESHRTIERDGDYVILPNISFSDKRYAEKYGEERLKIEKNSANEPCLDVDQTCSLLRKWGL